jgi:hypothetical protein
VVVDILSILKDRKDDFLIPTRLIIYNSKEIEYYLLLRLHYQWSENIFSQTPKVEILKEEELFKSLIFILNQQLINGEPYTEEFYEKDERMGFVIGKDIIDIKKETKKDNYEERLTEKKVNFFQRISIFISEKLIKISQLIKGLEEFLNNKTLNKLGFLFALVLILILLFVNEYFFHKAKIIVYLPTKKVSQVVDLDLDYFISTFSSSLKEQKTVTGVKTIGEKATGEVVVYNTNLNKEKVIKKGTEVESNGLKFVFNEVIIVASAESATLPGKATAKLIASQIGEEYNISKGKKFNIDDTSYAESINDFKGGSKKQIKVISQKDIDELENLILEKGQTVKNPKIDNKKISLINLRKINIEKKEIEGEIGEEADSVSYKATLAITDFYVSKDQLINRLIVKLKDNISDDFQIDKNGIIYKIKDYQLKQKKINLKIDSKVNFIKSFNTGNLLKEIRGKTKVSLDKILKKKYKALGDELVVKSFLPLFDSFLPIFKKNIEIDYSRY